MVTNTQLITPKTLAAGDVSTGGLVLHSRFSPTALDTYLRCPRQFQLRYLQRVQFEPQRSPQLLLGTVMHAALAQFMQRHPEDRHRSELHDMARKAWVLQDRRDLFSSRQHERALGLALLDGLDWLCRSDWLLGRPILIEHWAHTTLGTGGKVYGRLDRIDADKEGLHVIDYKSGGSRIAEDDEQQIGGEVSAMVYALAAQARFRRPVTQVTWLHPLTAETRSWHPDPEQLTEAAGWLGALLKRIRGQREFRAEPGPSCRFCPVAAHCSARAARSPESLAVLTA